jgi:hypothetical protein
MSIVTKDMSFVEKDLSIGANDMSTRAETCLVGFEEVVIRSSEALFPDLDRAGGGGRWQIDPPKHGKYISDVRTADSANVTTTPTEVCGP